MEDLVQIGVLTASVTFLGVKERWLFPLPCLLSLEVRLILVLVSAVIYVFISSSFEEIGT